MEGATSKGDLLADDFKIKLEALFEGKTFDAKASQLGHAEERAALISATGGGKAFTHHSHRNVIRRCKNIHAKNNGRDHSQDDQLRNRKKNYFYIPRTS